VPFRADIAGDVGQLCRAAIEGRHASKRVGALAKQFELTEPELEILWCLARANCAGVDQTTLAGQLAFSPAQVSACVEKLRLRGLIAHQEARGDRRRHLWQLTGEASELLAKVAVTASGTDSREAAA
jgi:DNA-binding MarR family transcriptional regulator